MKTQIGKARQRINSYEKQKKGQSRKNTAKFSVLYRGVAALSVVGGEWQVSLGAQQSDLVVKALLVVCVFHIPILIIVSIGLNPVGIISVSKQEE